MPQGVGTNAPAEVDQRQDQHRAGEPRPAHQRNHQEGKRQQVEEVERARAERGELPNHDKPACCQQDGDRQDERHEGDDHPLETKRADETDIGDQPVRHVGRVAGRRSHRCRKDMARLGGSELPTFRSAAGNAA